MRFVTANRNGQPHQNRLCIGTKPAFSFWINMSTASEARCDCQDSCLVARIEASILVFDTMQVLYWPVLGQNQFCSFDRRWKPCLDTKPVLYQDGFCSSTDVCHFSKHIFKFFQEHIILISIYVGITSTLTKFIFQFSIEMLSWCSIAAIIFIILDCKTAILGDVFGMHSPNTLLRYHKIKEIYHDNIVILSIT